MDIAFKYRNYFRKDVIIDLIVYRRWYVRNIKYHISSSLEITGDTTNSTSQHSPNR